MEKIIPTVSTLKSKTVKRENTIRIGREKNSNFLPFLWNSIIMDIQKELWREVSIYEYS